MFQSGIIAYQPIFEKLKSFAAFFDQTRNYIQDNEWYNQKFEINMTKFRDARRVHSLVGYASRNPAIAKYRVRSFFILVTYQYLMLNYFGILVRLFII